MTSCDINIISLFVDHLVVRQLPVPPQRDGLIYDYLLAGNGLFIRAQKPGLAVLLPLCRQPVCGLPEIEPYVRLGAGRIPQADLEKAIALAKRVCAPTTDKYQEIVFYWTLGDDQRWRMVIPDQIATENTVIPANDEPGSPYQCALVELHSHHRMPALFSEQDDAEHSLFRVHVVIGELFSERPGISARVSVYGHHVEIPVSWVFSNG